MTIPEVARRLRLKALETGDDELVVLAEALKRRRGAKPADPVSESMTDDLRDEIRTYAAEHPGLSQALIAIAFGVNQGRVSEALHGKRV